MCKSCFRSSRKAGLTLVEVIAALALLSTLLVGVLVAFNEHAEQIRHARRTLNALNRVDALLYQWTENGNGIPPDARGEIRGEDDLLWETQLVSTRHQEDLGVDVVRLQVFAGRKTVSDRPLLSVELAVPSPHWPPKGPGE